MKYRHQKYTYTNPFGSPRHQWEVVGPLGAVHFHVTIVKEYTPTAGLEFHHTDRCGFSDRAPDHVDCPLTGGCCWHDGTSLYATETLWPMIESLLQRGDHEAVFRILEQEADRRFQQFAAAHEESPNVL